MMNKSSIVLVIVTCLALFAGCGKKEYVVKVDESLNSTKVTDHQRVYYEIFVGAFSDANEDGTGDLQGIIQRLDYLNDGDPNSGKSLGIQGIWLMPIMKSPSYHKYDVVDYKSIDPKYGTLEDFEQLTREAEQRGINVIIDLVLNHTSTYNEWFRTAKQAVKDGDMTNKYVQYYTLVTEDTKEEGKIYYPLSNGYSYEANFSEQMPELNMDSPAVREEIVEILKFWFAKGVDGFRLDAAKYVYLNDTKKNIEFWNWFMDEVKKIKPDAYVVGETWSPDSFIAPYYESFSNFDFGMSQSSGAIATTANAYDRVDNYVKYLISYRNLVTAVNPEAILTPFVSNHDMNRAAGYLSVSQFKMHMAANLYLWTYGTPFLYYGEEIGMFGSRGSENTDANRRLAMLWGDKDQVSNPPGATYADERQVNGTVRQQLPKENSLLNHYKKVIMIRNANPEIGRGTYTYINFSSEEFFGGFLCTYKNSTVGVFHHTGEEPITIDLSKYTSHSFQEIRGFAGKGQVILNGQTLTIDGMTSAVLR